MATYRLILSRILEWILILLTACLVVVVFAEVVFRYIVNQSLAWSLDASDYLLIYITFIGAGLLIGEKGHIAVDVLVVKLPNSFKQGAQLLIDVLLLIAGCLLLYYGTTFTIQSGNGVSTGMQISVGYVYVALPVMGLIMLLYLAPQILEQVMKRGSNRSTISFHSDHLGHDRSD